MTGCAEPDDRGQHGRPRIPAAVIIGTGLIGTSVALALRAAGTTVWLADSDPEPARLAVDMGAGQLLPGDGPPGGPADIAVIAVPPSAVAAALAAAQQRRLARCYTDVASVKELPLTGARALGCDLASYVPGHPLSGREQSGPAGARAGLFAGRPWAVCPVPESDPACVAAVTELARACGAAPISMPAAEHDRSVALVSHVPHLIAAVLAARLELADDAALALAGPGLRDVTRIAAGDPAQWTQILAANAAHAQQVAAAAATEMHAAAQALAQIAEGGDAGLGPLADLLRRGRAGVARISAGPGGTGPGHDPPVTSPA